MTTYTQNEVLLRVLGISKKFDVPVLRDISFEIKNISRPGMTQGQIVSLVGKSGSGKSTLFNIMAGLLAPDKGEVLIGDTKQKCPIEGELLMNPVKEGEMGVVFQNSYLYEWRKVKDILSNAARKNPTEPKGNLWGRIEEISLKLDIEKLHDKYPSQISGGQRQRVAIAEQLLNGGDYILLDEPFSGLDTLSIDKVTKILTDIAATDEHKTIILISHDLSNSLAISDKAFILAKEEGKEGATITREICLAEMELAWQPGIKEDIRFRELLNQVKSYL